MLDAVDKVVKAHIQNLMSVSGKPIKVFSIATADTDDMVFTQAGMDDVRKPDKIQLPFASLIRLPNIDITDGASTKQIHNYTGYKFEDGTESILTYYRCTLHYNVTIFAETRKISEDLATSLYARLRNQNQIKVSIQLPIEMPNCPHGFTVAQMDSDIALTSTIEQVNTRALDKPQLYKCRIAFDVQNVNVYDFTEDKQYQYNVTVQAKLPTKNAVLTDAVKTVFEAKTNN